MTRGLSIRRPCQRWPKFSWTYLRARVSTTQSRCNSRKGTIATIGIKIEPSLRIQVNKHVHYKTIKSRVDRSVEIEEKMLYPSEVLDNLGFLESSLNEIATKVNIIDVAASRLDRMSIQELMPQVESLEDKVTWISGFRGGDSSTSFVPRIKEHVGGLNNSQKVISQMISEISKDVKAALNVVKAKVADLSVRLNLTMRSMGNQTPTRNVV